MGNMKFFENMINSRLLSLHTAYLARVLSCNGNTAKIQPLGKVQAYGADAQEQSPLSGVPIACTKIVAKNIEVVTNVSFDSNEAEKTTLSIPQVEPLAKGDIVICVCCERDISEARKGINSVPVEGHHSMSDSVIVGVL